MHKTFFSLIFHLILTPNSAIIFVIFIAFDQLPSHSESVVDFFLATVRPRDSVEARVMCSDY